MKKAQLVIRILLGFMLVIFGLNKFLQFMPMPAMPEAANEFMNALVNSGYLLIIVALIEVIGGIMLLINRYQPLVLVMVFPIIVNAFLFHLFLDPVGIGGAFFASVMNVFLLFANKESYASLFKAK
ncbi:DoxX family membrane protein [Aquimarina hainanensis]|uniref:DoxX family membrane protein n=1 Tax=Aquimarina hainanensis TaxID=1578017 RepID=A0ABW5NCY7_9FLAO